MSRNAFYSKRTIATSLAIVLGSLSLLLFNLCLWLFIGRDNSNIQPNDGDISLELPTARVETRDMIETMNLRCRFAPADTVPHKVSAAGYSSAPSVVTSMHAQVGDVVSAGNVLITISGRPVIVLPGRFPFYRDLRFGDEGLDVQQLQDALLELGLLSNGNLSGVLDASTYAGLDTLYTRTGHSVPTSDIVLPASEVVIIGSLPRVVAPPLPDVGAILEPGAPLFSTSSNQIVLDCPLTESQSIVLSAGMTASFATSSGTAVAALLQVPTTISESGLSTTGPVAAYRVQITPSTALNRSVLGDFTVATVTIAGGNAEVLAVPSTAIINEADGSTSIIVVDSPGDVKRGVKVPIVLGVTLGGWTEIEGLEHGIVPGMEVLLGTQ